MFRDLARHTRLQYTHWLRGDIMQAPGYNCNLPMVDNKHSNSTLILQYTRGSIITLGNLTVLTVLLFPAMRIRMTQVVTLPWDGLFDDFNSKKQPLLTIFRRQFHTSCHHVWSCSFCHLFHLFPIAFRLWAISSPSRNRREKGAKVTPHFHLRRWIEPDAPVEPRTNFYVGCRCSCHHYRHTITNVTPSLLPTTNNNFPYIFGFPPSFSSLLLHSGSVTP